jgi:6-phosphogluconolactonase
MRLVKLAVAVGVLVVGSFSFGASAAFASHGHGHGHGHGNHHGHGHVKGVYFETNTEPTNYVQSYFRNGDGTLDEGPLVETGGSGEDTASPFAPHGFPLLDSANSVVLNDSGRLLFAVNAGSDTISSFRITRGGPVLADQISSHGDLPISLAVRGHGSNTIVYVLNEWSGNIAGFRADHDGDLHFLSGSDRSLSVAGPNGAAAMVGFDANGKTLTVSQRGAILDPVTGQYIGTGPDLIDVFKMHNDRPGPAVQNPSVGEDPFGFGYTSRNQLMMSDSGIVGTATSYKLNQGTGGLTPISHLLSNGSAPCWVVITNDDKYTYMTNSINSGPPFNSISRFKISHQGELSFLGLTPTTYNAALDEDSSDNGKYLYVLNTLVVPDGPPGHFLFVETRVDQLRIQSNGDLTFLGTTDPVPFGGSSGLAAH